MQRPRIIDKAGDPKYIPGIYNYCDQWCERCPLTSRCLNYNMSEEPMEGDVDNGNKEDAFLNEMQETFDKTIGLLEYIAAEQGIDLDKIEPDPDYEIKAKQRRQEAASHELATTSMQYADLVGKWLSSAAEILNEKAVALSQNINLGIREEETREDKAVINNAIEVIKWYQFQIHVKLMRALSYEDDFLDEDDEDFQSDADGSAKVALIGMDRSIGAWGILHKQLPDLSDEILDFLVMLEQLRRTTEKSYPKARAFVRPGFDTGATPA